MEFERRTRQGKVLADQREKREKEEDEIRRANETSEGLRAGMEEKQKAENVAGGASEKAASENSPTTTTTTTTAAAAGEQAEQAVHNLSKAMQLAQNGDELGAALVPLRLSSIRIEGARNVRPSFLARLCRPYVDPTLRVNSTTLDRLIYAHRLSLVKPGQSTSLPGLLGLLASIGTDAGSLDLFSDVQASLEPSRIVDGQEDDVDVVLRCKERSRFFAKSSTEVGNGEGMAALQATMRNVFGGAETADVSATIGTRTRRAFHASLSSPLFALPDHTVSLSAFAQDRDLSGFASATEGARGARLALRYSDHGNATGLGSGVHELAYDICHRHLGRLLPTASLGMRRLAGHSVKSSISHSFTLDLRDSFVKDVVRSAFPLQGVLFKSNVEYAGLGGDANHIKAEWEAQQIQCFGHDDQFGASLTARLGALASLNGRPPAFSDRFQLGGPTSIRMFRYGSLGPKDSLDSLGGEAFASIGASTVAPMWPGKAHWPIKWHAFINGGQLIQLDHEKQQGGVRSWAQRNGSLIWNDLIARPSTSVGFGILFRQGGLRAEVNVGVPLTMRKGDGARKGVQLGIGVDFL